MDAGFPWSGAHVRSANKKLAWSAGAETALLRRWEGYAGLETHLLDRSNQSIRFGLRAGWVHQVGVLGRQGPQAAALVEWEWSRWRRFVPRIVLIEKAFWARSIQQPDDQGLEDTVSLLTPLHSRVVQGGVAFALGQDWLVETAIRVGPVDGKFAIPAISIGLRNRSDSSHLIPGRQAAAPNTPLF